MMNDSALDNGVFKEYSGLGEIDSVVGLAEKLDFIDIQVLRKFYTTGNGFPDDTRPCCFPVLFREMRASKQINLGLEALRKRLDNLVRVGFLEKSKHSNPVTYYPIKEKERVIRAVIMKFFFINGLAKYL